MSKFIKLTSINGNAFFANKDFIGHIVEDTYEKRGYQIPCTRICLTTNNNGGMQIKESIAEVFELMGMPVPVKEDEQVGTKTVAEIFSQMTKPAPVKQESDDLLSRYDKKVNNRMELIMDDVNDIRNYIEEKLAELLPEEKETILTHLANIEIASDLTDTEADCWYIIKNG